MESDNIVNRLRSIALNSPDRDVAKLLDDAAAMIQQLEPENYYLKTICEEQKATIAALRLTLSYQRLGPSYQDTPNNG